MTKVLLCISIVLIFAPAMLKAQEQPTVLRDIGQKLSLLESKISRLSETQSQIIQKNQEINQELDSLRIWIRRNRS